MDVRHCLVSMIRHCQAKPIWEFMKHVKNNNAAVNANAMPTTTATAVNALFRHAVACGEVQSAFGNNGGCSGSAAGSYSAGGSSSAASASGGVDERILPPRARTR